MNTLKSAAARVERFIRHKPGLEWGSRIYEPEENDFSPTARLTRRYLEIAYTHLRKASSPVSAERASELMDLNLTEEVELECLEGPEGAELVQFIAAVRELVATAGQRTDCHSAGGLVAPGA